MDSTTVTKTAFEAIKDCGIKVFTVAVMVGAPALTVACSYGLANDFNSRHNFNKLMRTGTDGSLVFRKGILRARTASTGLVVENTNANSNATLADRAQDILNNVSNWFSNAKSEAANVSSLNPNPNGFLITKEVTTTAGKTVKGELIIENPLVDLMWETGKMKNVSQVHLNPSTIIMWDDTSNTNTDTTASTVYQLKNGLKRNVIIDQAGPQNKLVFIDNHLGLETCENIKEKVYGISSYKTAGSAAGFGLGVLGVLCVWGPLLSKQPAKQRTLA